MPKKLDPGTRLVLIMHRYETTRSARQRHAQVRRRPFARAYVYAVPENDDDVVGFWKGGLT